MKSTKQPSPVISKEVEQVRRRFERWRRTRKKRSRIPEPLWEAAVEVAEGNGVNPTATALGLGYYELKKRLESSRGVACEREKAMGSFVELARAPLVLHPECLVELESASGTKMRIHFRGVTAPDVDLLRNLFWGSAS